MAIELYIGGKPVDISENTVIPLNFVHDNLTNPTATEVNFSKTITLPASPNNDKVFGHIWRIDSRIFSFDPSERVEFALTQDGDVIEEGFVELKHIDYLGHNPISYEIELSGGLGDFFYELSEKTVDQLADNETFAGNYEHRILNEAVRDSWYNDYYKYILSYSGQYDNFENDTLFQDFSGLTDRRILDTIEVDGLFYNLTVKAIIVFDPSEDNASIAETGLPETVDRITYDTRQNRFIAWSSTENIIYYTSGKNLTVWTRYAIFPSNVFVRDVKSYALPSHQYMILASNGRLYYGTSLTSLTNSYNLNNYATRYAGISFKPGITLQFFVHGLASSADAGTAINYCYRIAPEDNNIALLFNSSTLEQVSSTILDNGLIFVAASNRIYYNDGSQYVGYVVSGAGTIKSVRFGYESEGTSYVTAIDDQSQRLYFTYNVRTDLSVEILTDPDGYKDYATLAYDSKNDIWQIGCFAEAGNTALRYGPTVNSYAGWKALEGFYEQIDVEQTESDEHQRNEFRSYYQRPCVRLKHIFNEICNQSSYTVVLDPDFFNSNNPYWEKTWIMLDRLRFEESRYPNEEAILLRHGNIRSGDPVTFDLMMKKNITQFDFIIQFCQTFGLIFEKSKVGKTITIWTRKTFFGEATIDDWTDRVDLSKAYRVKPYPYNFKYMIFNWGNNGTYYEDRYKSNFNRYYGTARIDTGFQFGNAESQLTGPDFTNIAISQEYDRFFEGRGSLYRDDKVLPAAFTKKNNIRENTELSMVLLFDQGFQNLSTPISITDDTSHMIETGLYAWGVGESITADSIPLMTRLTTNGTASLDFARPAETYYELPPAGYPDGVAIYDKFWGKYIEERYSKETKVRTIRVYIKPDEINRFRTNKFVKIEDTIWHVNRIIDYAAGRDITTKVELLRVTDLNAYSEGLSFVQHEEKPYLNVDVNEQKLPEGAKVHRDPDGVLTGISNFPASGGDVEFLTESNRDCIVEHAGTRIATKQDI